jgi:hypothetical protein
MNDGRHPLQGLQRPPGPPKHRSGLGPQIGRFLARACCESRLSAALQREPPLVSKADPARGISWSIPVGVNPLIAMSCQGYALASGNCRRMKYAARLVGKTKSHSRTRVRGGYVPIDDTLIRVTNITCREIRFAAQLGAVARGHWHRGCGRRGVGVDCTQQRHDHQPGRRETR